MEHPMNEQVKTTYMKGHFIAVYVYIDPGTEHVKLAKHLTVAVSLAWLSHCHTLRNTVLTVNNMLLSDF